MTQWLIIWRTHCPSDPQNREAVDAIRHIGTNALPYLLAWIQDKPSPWEIKLENFARTGVRTLFFLPSNSVFEHWLFGDESGTLAARSEEGFRILGPTASAAVPELTRLLDRPAYNTHLITLALSHLGADGLPPIMAAVTNPHAPNRLAVIESLSGFDLGPDGRPLIPLLVKSIDDPDESVAQAAVRALGRQKLAPELVVGELTKRLQSPDESVLVLVIAALGRFGEQSRPALPALTNLLNHSVPEVRDEVSNSLQRIGLEELNKTGKPEQGVPR